MEQEAQLLSSYLHFRKLGIPLGTPSAKEWLPSHELALSTIMSHQAPSISVTKEQALRFLKKEEFSSEHVPKGWYVVRYQGLALGWIKSIGNRYNNYLPKHWRIRMELPDEAVN
jgi:NOL1/NOP2/fmu family ribosome biogenesis protein